MKLIEIDVYQEDVFFDKYNKKEVSLELINYLINNVSAIILNESIKVIINNKLKNKHKCIPLLIDGLKKEYNKSVLNYMHNSKVQVIYSLLGIITIFISTLITNSVIKEVVLIGGWVLIWSMIEIEIFTDMKIIRKRKVLKKLIESEMQEKFVKK